MQELFLLNQFLMFGPNWRKYILLKRGKLFLYSGQNQATCKFRQQVINDEN